MKVTLFATKVALQEGKKVSVSVAQVAEILRIVNRLLGGKLYGLIRES